MRTTPAIFPEKMEAENKMYAVDFTPVLETGASIASVTWTSIPTGITFDNESLASNKATARLLTGVGGKEYQISVKGVTDETPAQTFEGLVGIAVIDGT